MHARVTLRAIFTDVGKKRVFLGAIEVLLQVVVEAVSMIHLNSDCLDDGVCEFFQRLNGGQLEFSTPVTVFDFEE